MQKADLTRLDDRLHEIADAVGSKAIGPKGLKVWLDVLSGERFDDVLSVLTDWCKKNSRMPMPADVLKSVQEMASRRIEAQAEENRRNSIGVEDALRMAAKNSTSNPEMAKRELANIRSVLGTRSGGCVAGTFQHIGGHGDRDDHKRWAKVLRAKEEAGEQLSLTQAASWREALGVVDAR